MVPDKGIGFWVPVEFFTHDDKTNLIEVQSHLRRFGFHETPADLARYIQANDVFSTELQMKIYPVLQPSEFYGIYQSWE